MLEKKAKNSGQIRRTFFALLGNRRSRAFLTFLLKKKHHVPTLCFPVNISAVNEVLIILPEQQLQVLHQLKNVISLMTLFKHAGITLLCEHSVAPLIKMVPGLNIIEYDAQDHFSSEFSSIAQQFRGKIDICFLLDTTPDLPMLYLAGSTAAQTRVGYCDAGDYPFLNLHIRPSTQRVYLADVYSSMAEVFGAKPGELRWRVAKKTIEEIDHLIKELKMKPDVPLIGFDAVYFIRNFGTEWTDSFMRKISDLKLGTIYFHVENSRNESEVIWLCKQNVPSFADLSASRLAALVSKSNLILTGNTSTYALAGLLHRPAVGFFREDEIARYCPQTPLLTGVTFTDRPDEQAIDQCIHLIQQMSENKKEK